MPLSGPGGDGGGAVVLAADRKPLVVADLLPAPPGKVWEVWTIPQRRRARLGRPDAGRLRQRAELQQPLAPGTTVAITPSPTTARSTRGPTGSIALSGGVS